MWTLKSLCDHCNTCSVEINEKWVPARPLSMLGIEGLIQRLKDAWKVVAGEAEAFTWPEGQ